MQAVWLTAFGAPEVLVAGTAPDPRVGPGQAVIEVAYANITFIETMFRATGFGPFPKELPMIPGNGVGGVVRAVGSGVDQSLVGRRVIAGTGGSGGYAEQATVDAEELIEVPAGLALDAAVALLADGRTAALLVRAVKVCPGDRVFVAAAAGGVGSLLVQLAVAAGAQVVAAAGGAGKLAVPARLGAELCVDYTAPGWQEQVGAVDVVFEGVGGDLGRAAFGLLGPGGRMLSHGFACGEPSGIDEQAAAERGVELIGMPMAAAPERLAVTADVLARAAGGKLTPVIGRRLPLARAAEAHRAIEERRTVGKTLMEAAPQQAR
jgi:NADPH2:quinone reductase